MKKIYVGLVLLLVIGCAALIVYGMQKINMLSSQNASLQAKTNSLQENNKKLTSMNANLQKAYKALDDTQETSAAGSSEESLSEDSSIKATSSFSIDKVQKLPVSSFGGAGDRDVLAVTVTIKNLSSIKQTYSTGDFIAITKTGVVQRINWANGYPGVGDFWMYSTVAPGGSLTEVLAWHYEDYANLGFSTIEFSPPDSTPTQSLPLPALSN